MNGNNPAMEQKLDELSYWREWMRHHIPLSGMDTPSEESCLLFATRAVMLADELVDKSGQPNSVTYSRSQLIQALALQMCWERAVELGRKHKPLQEASSLGPIVEAREVVAAKHNGFRVVLEASDGHYYSVGLPTLGREMARATQVICLELARLVGLPVPAMRLILVSRQLALSTGIQPGVQATGTSEQLSCLGVREFGDELKIEDSTKPRLPLSHKTSAYLSGRVVFNLLVLNLIPEELTFRRVQGYAEPCFRHFSHCLMGADWTRFLSATSRQSAPVVCGEKVKSYEQLEIWIRRIEKIDFEQILELAVKLPPSWYGNRPALLSAVFTKLEERRREIRESLLRLVKAGLFPRITELVVNAKRRQTTA